MTLESIISTMLEAQKAQENLSWHQADMLAEAAPQYGRDFAKAIAAETVWTTRHINALIKCAKTFKEDQRIPRLSFKLHIICSRTSDPLGWLAKCEENAWSERQLKDALKDAKDTGDTQERAKKKGERLAKSIEEYAASFGGLATDQLARIRNLCDTLMGVK